MFQEPHRVSIRLVCLSLTFVAALVVSGCSAQLPSATPTPSQSQHVAPPSPASLPRSTKSCQTGDGTDESPLRGHGALRMAGLVFMTGHLGVGDSTKFVWRVTGDGDPTFVATGPDGTTVHPNWGPEDHGDGSNSTSQAASGEWRSHFPAVVAGSSR